MQHFQLHFEPQHRVLYQEPTGQWLIALWQDIACATAIKRIQYNTEQLQNYIIVDIDNSDIYKYREANLPEPNFIVKNKHKAGGHLFWVLDRTIATPYYKRLWKEVFKSFTVQAGGDTAAKGFIAKNLNNNIDFDIEFIELIAYNINYLNHYKAKVKKRVSKVKVSKRTDKLIVTEGRNETIFYKTRFMAYAELRRSINDKDFEITVSHYAEKLNNDYDYPLEENELEGITASVVKFCLANKARIKNSKSNKKRGTMQLDNLLSTKQKQKKGAEYTAKIKATKTELKIQVGIIEMKKQELKINVSSVSKYTKLSRPTVTKYKHFLF